MREQDYRAYTCGCKKFEEYEEYRQCIARVGTNVSPVTRLSDSQNMSLGHKYGNNEIHR
jgi:hypothetical protein